VPPRWATFLHSQAESSKQPVVTPRRTADEYSNAVGQRRRTVTAIAKDHRNLPGLDH